MLLLLNPIFMGNNTHDFYRKGNWVLSETYIGSNTFDNWNKMERNLTKIYIPDQDYFIVSDIPKNPEWRTKYINQFSPVLKDNDIKYRVTGLLEETKQQEKKIDLTIAKAKGFSANSEIGKSHKKFDFGAETFISYEDNVHQFIKNIQNHFKDKAIIIDLWATWCAPCLSDMKDSKAVKEQIKELPVEIVYVLSLIHI